jgi:N-acetylglutamate synthase-like GNAT family acetyltransferase
MEIIRYATLNDCHHILEIDYHINLEIVTKKINNFEIFVLEVDSIIVGVLRYGFFWDEIPFMNLIMFKETYRHQGLGKKLVLFYENEMRKKGKRFVMTSTLSCESAQHFYRKLGYLDCGSLLIEKEGLEIIFGKKL